MDRGQADALVAELGQHLGIAGLALDDGGSCSLAINEGEVIVNLGYNPGAHSIDMMICLDAVDTARMQLHRVLLANFGWLATSGAAFAMEPVTGALVLQRRCPAEELVSGGLQAPMESLVATAEAWSKRLVAMANEDGSGAGRSNPSGRGMLGAEGLRP